jgi:hypothetical protein
MMCEKVKNLCLIMAVVLFGSAACKAKVELPALISDNMVIQRDAFIKIWGTTEPGSEIKVKADWQGTFAKTTCSKDGKWLLFIKTPTQQGPYEITISDGDEPVTLKNVLAGEVWLCSGQSNMAFGLRNTESADEDIPKADYPAIRFFGVKQKLSDSPLEDCEGSWLICKPDVAKWCSGTAYYFAQKLHSETGFPIGIIQAAVGGTPAEAWMSKDTLLSTQAAAAVIQRYDELMQSYPQRFKKYQQQLRQWQKIENNPAQKPRIPMGPEYFQRPCGLWNGMIAPLLNYRIAGVLWYQGEANSWRAEQYRRTFPMLISSWRSSFKQGRLPFYYVQIAPFNYDTPLIAAELRQAQLETLNLAKTAMVCTMDIGDNNDIHPKNKKDVGCRLANVALNRLYNKDIADSGPVYAAMEIECECSKLRLYFSNADNGLVVKNHGRYFEIAGPDGNYLPAEIEIDGNTLLIKSDMVSNPVNARYGWSNTAGASLFNKEALPAYPFRTDNSVWTTQGNLKYF